MRDLYDQLVAEGEPAVARLVTERRQENVALEFKTKEKASVSGYSKDDNETLEPHCPLLVIPWAD
jgi:hypothetical protein